ncbi:Protein T02H6.11 [Aphelenchoides avenae]|nr:Protein T02H6.11 [Aphelenchus avenae]
MRRRLSDAQVVVGSRREKPHASRQTRTRAEKTTTLGTMLSRALKQSSALSPLTRQALALYCTQVTPMPPPPKRPWMTMPGAAPNVVFKRDGPTYRFLRWFAWTYCWSGKERGLQYCDQYFEPAPEVQEALRRLNQREPWVYDQRQQRLLRASNLAMMNDFLPKQEWTKWEEETWYLKPYLTEIEAEKAEVARSTGLVPGFWRKIRAQH